MLQNERPLVARLVNCAQVHRRAAFVFGELEEEKVQFYSEVKRSTP